MHGLKVPGMPGRSILHWKVAASDAPSEKPAVVSFVVDPCAGPPAIEVVGGVVSTVQVQLAGVASRLPEGSLPRT